MTADPHERLKRMMTEIAKSEAELTNLHQVKDYLQEESAKLEAQINRKLAVGESTHIEACRVREIRMEAIRRRIGLEELPDWFSETGLDRIIRATGMTELAGLAGQISQLNFAVMMFSAMRLTDCGRRTATRFTLSEGLTYKLLATDLKGAVVGDLKLPLDAFYIELPEDVLFQRDAETGWHAVRMLIVSTGSITTEILDKQKEAGDETAPYVAPGRRLVIESYGSLNSNSQHIGDDTWLFQSYNIDDDTAPIDEDSLAKLSMFLTPHTAPSWDMLTMRLGKDGRLLVKDELRAFLIQLVLNFCVYIGSDRAEKRWRHEQEVARLIGGKKRKNLRKSILDRIVRLEQDRVFDVGTSITIDSEFKSYVLTGKGTGASLTYRSLVRGHWRNQAHGPKRALRKNLWIEPHIRGADLPTKAVGHTYEVKE